jgi:hypothetical protein
LGMAEEMIAYCGLDCLSCRAYTATKENDLEKLRETAELWSVGEREKYVPEDILCDGCFSDRLHKFCLACPVRLCGGGRGVENCAGCGDYPCDKLEKLWGVFATASGAVAKKNLERLKASSHVTGQSINKLRRK